METIDPGLLDRAYTIDHFFTKLLKLASSMNTAPAKREAEERTQFMRLFLNQFEAEVQGLETR